MEIGPVMPRVGPQNAGTHPRPAPTAPAETVKAELPATAVDQISPAPDADQAPQRAAGESVDRRITFDPVTQQVIYQAVDTESGEVVRQVPEEAMLRLQVYARALRRAAAGESRSQ